MDEPKHRRHEDPRQLGPLSSRLLSRVLALISLSVCSGCQAAPDGTPARDTLGPIGPLPEPAGSGACQHVAWSPDSRLVACYGFYGFDGNRPTVRRTLIVDVDDGRILQTLEDVMWASFSPDGTRIVFTRLLDGDRELFTSALDGSDLQQLTDNTADDQLAVWSPAGDLIAFCSDRNGKRNLYTMAVDGTEVRQITSVDAADYSPEWNGDGTRLTFYREVGDGLDQVYTIRPDGTDLVLETLGLNHNIYPAFSRDGRLLFRRSPKGAEAGELVAYDPRTGDAIVLTTGAHIARQSPDGRRIAYVASGFRKNAIFVADGDGSGLRKLVE